MEASDKALTEALIAGRERAADLCKKWSHTPFSKLSSEIQGIYMDALLRKRDSSITSRRDLMPVLTTLNEYWPYDDEDLRKANFNLMHGDHITAIFHTASVLERMRTYFMKTIVLPDPTLVATADPTPAATTEADADV